MDVFFYIKKQDEERVLECGLRLSEWAERKVFLSGIRHLCLRALLNPMDDAKKFADESYIPIKIRVNPKAALVAEGIFYDDSLFDHGMNERYNNSVISLEKYEFGKYRKPECLLAGTVGNRYLKKMDRRIDVPVLYTSSEEIYVQALMDNGREWFRNFEERLLYRYYSHLAGKGLYKLHTTVDSEYAIFENESSKHIVTIKKV